MDYERGFLNFCRDPQDARLPHIDHEDSIAKTRSRAYWVLISCTSESTRGFEFDSEDVVRESGEMGG